MARSSGAGAIIVAAGASRRMGGKDKLFLSLLGSPLLSYTLAVFQEASSVEQMVLVLSAANLSWGRALVQEGSYPKLRAVCVGGERRQDSVRRGLEGLTPCSWVVVHDGARPCLEPDLIERGLREARAHGSAVAAMPLRDTLKAADPTGAVERTVSRDGLWTVQTPQIFPFDVLWRAHHQEDALPAPDDASLVERLGYPVRLYLGSPTNIKVTTPEDVPLAEALLARRGGPAP